MDIQKEREAFQKFCEENFDFENHEQTYFDDQTQCYENDVGEDTASINIAWMAWQQAKKSAVPEWISLEDVEPNIGETVLICWSDGFDVEPEKDFMDVDIDSGVHYWSNFENDEPTHWMPIPQPPKAQEQVG